jgi:phage FluMu protein gp41
LGEPTKTLRQRGADSFHAALAAVLTAGLNDALDAGDHPKAISIINRGFAEGSPQMGCDLLCRAITVVGAARTWTVQLAPLTRVPERSARPDVSVAGLS